MKPFNLDEALAGKPVITADGKPVEEIYYFKKANIGSMRVYAAIEGLILNYYENGRSWTERHSGIDLFMASEKKSGWINIYNKGGTSGEVYTTKEEADRAGVSERVACVKVEWEE